MGDLNRRQFLLAAGAAAAVISLPVLQSGAAPAGGDSAPVNIGALKDYSKDGVTKTWAPRNKGAFFVVRQDGKLYACSSICTHKGALLTLTPTDFLCPKHHSHFSYEGTVTDGPADSSLERYAISTNADGHVMVDTSKSFSETNWTDPASFVSVS